MEVISIKLMATNCFLLKTGDRYVLIDTGYEIDWESFCKRLQESEVTFSQISHLILTHHHDDHCGLLNYIVRENNNLRVVMAAAARELLTKGKNTNTHGYYFINKRVRVLWLFQLKRLLQMATTKKYIDSKNNLKFPPYRVRDRDLLISDDIRLKDLGICLDGSIIKTPGHSIDSISVLLDDGNCFVGDAAANILQFAGTKYCVVGISDLDEYYRSWQKLIAAGARHIFPAHGKPFPVVKLQANLGKNKKQNMVMVCP
jgi:hydroxyacylglutathione hydrolase